MDKKTGFVLLGLLFVLAVATGWFGFGLGTVDFGLGGGGGSGKGKAATPEGICAQIAQAAAQAGEEIDDDWQRECMQFMGIVQARCENADAVFACLGGATGEAGIEACEDVCQKK